MNFFSFKIASIHWKSFPSFFVFLLLSIGCETTGPNNSNNGYNESNSGSAVLRPDLSEQDNSEIRSDDLLQLVVQLQPEFSVSRRVTSDGNILIPILGQLQVAGKQPEVVESEIKQMLLDGYLTDPEVILIVVEKAKKRFVIIGQVKNPGYYSAPGEMEVTLIEAAAMAGGYTRIAGNVAVTRVVNGQERKFNINRKSKNEDVSFIVLPGDLIEVEESLF